MPKHVVQRDKYILRRVHLSKIEVWENSNITMIDLRISEYIRTNKLDTNECPNIFVKEKLIQTNVRIYICDQYI